MTAKHFIKNSELLALVSNYNSAVKAAKAEGKEPPPIPNKIGLAFWKMSERLGDRYNFRKYPFLDEMIADGYEDCLKRMHNFDPTRTNNAFGYFTIVLFRAFVRRIKLEKRYLKTKLELTERLNLLGLTSDNAEGDRTNYGIEVAQSDETLEYLK